MDSPRFGYTVDGSDIIQFVSNEWLEFAKQNGWEGQNSDSVIGKPIWDFIAGKETRHLYQLMFGRARSEGQEIRLPFRCDSPDLRRFMELTITPIGDGGLDLSGVIIRQEPQSYAAVLDSNAKRNDDLLRMCSWCKKLDLSDKGWVEAETAVNELGLFDTAEVPEISHGICPSCKHELVF